MSSPIQVNIKKLVLALLVLGVVGGAYHYQDRIRALYVNSFAAPCSRPLTYRIDSVDSRFGISPDKFKQAIAEAAQIWDKAEGKQLFEYKDNGEIAVSLVYDDRQAATDQLTKLHLNVDNTRASYDQLKAVYDRDQAQYKILKQQYDDLNTQYQTLKQSYERDVRAANSRGGVTQQEADQLNAERDQLNALVDKLNNAGNALNQLVDTINALATTLNRIGGELNLDVSAYNQVGKNLGEFEEGVYTQEGATKTIVIYEYKDYSSLVRVLAHELGHSLGMEHVENPNSIMYKLNQSKNMSPTKEDLAELARVCKQ